MDTPKLCVAFLCVLYISHATCQETKQFPLENCSSADFDVLILTDSMCQSDCSVPIDVAWFYNDTMDMFQLPREGLTFNLVSYSSPNLTTIEYHEHSHVSLATNRSTSERKHCTATYTTRPKESKVFLIVDFIYNYFSQRQTDKARVSSVALLIIAGPKPGAVADVSVIQKGRYHERNIKLFVIMADFRQEMMQISQIPNTLYVPSISNINHNQLISMFVCGQCKRNWFVLNQKHSRNLISCYFLDIDEGHFKNWFDGRNRCLGLGSSLVSIETREEHDFLEGKVVETLRTAGDVPHVKYIFIGLSRDRDSLVKRFYWLSRNPFIATQWVEGRPHKDYLQGCVVWKFQAERANLSSLTNERNFSQHQLTFKNGWVDVGCGVSVSYTSLCEVDLQIPNMGDKRSLTVMPAKLDAINNAIKKGEFVKYNENIVSIAAHAGNPFFYNSLQAEYGAFKLFTCDEFWFNSKPLSYSQICDRRQNCIFGGDEGLCLFRNCDPDKEFPCTSGQCVPAGARCDLHIDCFDGSDELLCTECKQRRCCEGSCIPKHWLAELDCDSCSMNNVSLYDDTKGSNGENCAFICNRTSCVYSSQIGDGVVDCTGPEGPLDEQFRTLDKVKSCNDKERGEQWAPRCVYIRDRYNGILGCRDMSHLWNCENATCPVGYAKCPDSYCIPLHLAQDGTRDCPLGEDEQFTTDNNCQGNFACADTLVCLDLDLVCDGSPQCALGDDELNCHTTCASGFKCLAGTVSVKDYDKKIPLSSLKFVDVRTRLLDLSGLNISGAITGADVTHLVNLLVIKFSDCKLTTSDNIFSSAISNLQSIYYLDLSYNLLKIVSKYSSFRSMSNLRILDLSYNKQLAHLEDKAFLAYNGKSLLESLNLQHTSIAVLSSSVLEGLTTLKVLNLSNTLITTLYKDTFPKDFRLQYLDFRETSILAYGTYSFNGLWIDKYMYTDNFGLCCPEIRGERISQDACQSPDDTISSCDHLVREKVQRVLLWLVGIVAVLGNITVILCRLVWNHGVIKKSYGVFVTNLGISDLIMGLYLLIIASADFYYTDNYVLNGTIWRLSTTCQVAGFLSTLSSETSAFFIMLVTLDRYLVMKFPFGQCHFSKRGVLAATCLSWVVGFTLAVIPLLPMFNTWNVYSSNGMCLGLPLNSDKMAGWRFSVSVFIILNSVIFLVIVVGQFSIYRAMSENRAVASAVQNSKRRAQDIAVAKQLSLIVLSNFLCWFPIGLMGLLAFTGHELSNNVYTWSAVLVLPVNSALNPVLYTVPILHDKFRQFVASHAKQFSKGDNCVKGGVSAKTA